MKNLEVSRIFRDIADLLELSGGNPFKIRAYRKAAAVLTRMGDNFDLFYREDKLDSIPGIGPKLAEAIKEIVRTGKSRIHEELQASVPRGLTEIKAIPGVGPKAAQIFYHYLNITSIDELEKAAREKRLRELPGMGSKTELAVLRGIDLLRSGAGRLPIGVARPLAETLTGFLEQLPGVQEVAIVGDLRRWEETVGTIELLVVAPDPDVVFTALSGHPAVKETVRVAQGNWQGKTWGGAGLSVTVADRWQFPVAQQQLTGSERHNQQLKAHAAKQGLTLQDTALLGGEPAVPLALDSEADLYQKLGLQYIPPEIRSGGAEIARALDSQLPDLVELSEIRGDLHLHTDWTDGVSTLEEMAAAAQRLGYEYMAVTDHSQSLVICHGLNEERLQAQREEIDRLNRTLDGFTILHGIEVDILSDRTLDFADHILADLDVVVASIHTGFRQDAAVLTERALAAVKNKHVDILAHPTGRLLGRRPAYQIDIEAILDLAAKTGTALEINASPDRLDLTDRDAGRAADRGIKIAINSDAHDTVRLAEMRYGVAVARRGWVKKEQVLNTMSLKELRRHLKK